MSEISIENIKVSFISELRPKSNVFIWNLNGYAIRLRSLAEKDRDILYLIISNLKNSLINTETLISSSIKGGKRSPLNIMKLMVCIFPELSKSYIDNIISSILDSGDNKSYYKYSTIFAKMFDNRYIRQYIGQVPEFDALMYESITKAIIIKNSLSSVVTYSNKVNVEYKKKIEDNLHLWKVNDFEIELFGFNKYCQSLLTCICYTLKEKMHNTEPLIDDLYKQLFPKKTFSLSQLPQIAYISYPDNFTKYIEVLTKKFTENRIIISRQLIMDEITGGYSIKYDKLKSPCYLDVIHELLSSEYKKQLNKLPSKNLLDLNQDEWKIINTNEFGTMKLIKLDFTRMENLVIRSQLKAFCKYLLKYTDDYKYIQDHLSRIIVAFEIISKIHRNIQSCADIDISIVNTLMNEMQFTAISKLTKTKYKLSTLTNIVGSCRKFFDYLVQNRGNNVTYPELNPFDAVSFHYVENIKENTEYIPETVVLKLFEHIDYLPAIFQRILLIALNTGLRFKEISFLENNCLSQLDPDATGKTKWKLEFVPWKVLEARRKRDLDDYAFIVVDNIVADEIWTQIKETEEIRANFETSRMFFKVYTSPIAYRGESVYIVTACGFNKAVNKLINEFKITDETGHLWKFNSKQCRKTVAVDMITNGASPQEVSYLLNHLQVDTTNKYYSEVRKMKLAEMNSDFFRNKFNLLVSEEQLSSYSEQERRLLYIGFCTDYREVEFGKCIKPFWEGECKRVGSDEIVCAVCDKLCTSISSLPKWLKLRDSKRELINSIIQLYEKSGIKKEEYAKFREYQKEEFLLNAYIDVINKIEERVKVKNE